MQTNWSMALAAAVEIDNILLMKWLVTNVFVDSCAHAASHGNLRMLKALRLENIFWNVGTLVGNEF